MTNGPMRPTASSRRRCAAPVSATTGNGTSWPPASTVSRDPARVPFTGYALHPVACARIIGDYAIFHVQTSGPALADSLRRARIDARSVRPPARGLRELQPGEVVMEMTTRTAAPAPAHLTRTLGPGATVKGSRTLQMRRSELDRYLIELLDHVTWIGGIKYLLAGYQFGSGRPWPHYRGEDQA